MKDLDAAAKKYSAVLGVEPKPFNPDEFALPGLRGITFSMGDVDITLVTGDPGTPIAKFLESRGEGVFLLSLEVTDVEEDMKEIAKKGVEFVVDKPMTSKAGGKVNWGHPRSMHGVQWEFYQPPKS